MLNPGGLGPRARVNERGGFMILLSNATGAASVKGMIVEYSNTTDNSYMEAVAGGPDPIGVVYNAGVPNGQDVWVVVSGPAQTLLVDSTTATREYWAQIDATVDGRADCTDPTPPGGTINAIEGHLDREIGHCMENQAAGTDVLCWIHLHFN